MAVGALGANGAHALKRVALEDSIAVGTATNQHQRMEENTVLVNTKSQGTAIQTLAQVSMLRSVKQFPLCEAKRINQQPMNVFVRSLHFA